eukprot:CAMPEP_0184696154 /NCGR_PEP_ID=MMETSP0313-20130426/3543_1 /TAXON_ID=2792 /ORGANISM="Porphyridium aerugineum, Strain SAG 1380-2" /LENGTH=212 /DNA_ID=CAMNT_0027154727 /DNA_START=6 /DNA_END=644 /DNA_ORIENTATION=+
MSIYDEIFNQYARDGNLRDMIPLYNQHKGVINVNWRNPDDDEDTALRQAAFYGRANVVAWLLQQTPANIRERNKYGNTALSGAVFNGHAEVTKMLIMHGACVNEKSIHGYTALHWAAFHGFDKVVQVLLQHGATLDDRNNKGETPVMRAATEWHRKVLRRLLTHGANLYARNLDGMTALRIREGVARNVKREKFLVAWESKLIAWDMFNFSA